VKSADVVIVGAGPIGASVAWHLVRAGAAGVLLLERGARPGIGGSAARATGGYRAQFGSAINVRLSLLAREKLVRFREEVGADPGYRPTGYLFLAETEAQLRGLAAMHRVQRESGFDEARLIDRDEVSRLHPAASLEGVIGASFGPSDGFIRPLQILEGYLQAALRGGAQLRCACEVVGLERAGDRASGVRLAGGERIAAGTVVNAAGAWAAPWLASAGIDLPVVPLKRQIAPTLPFPAFSEDWPMLIWPDGFHLRGRDGRVLLLWPKTAVPAHPFDAEFDPAWLVGLHETASRRVPMLARATIDAAGAWAGLYEMSPDHHAILGEAPEARGLFYANGSSGHGVMHSPALGQLLAELILDGAARTLDIRALRPGRFVEGALNREVSYL
jgi:sarcosine oxidase subunit beta